MTALVQAISRISATPNSDFNILRPLGLFVAAGVFVFFLAASYGLDLSPGFF